MSTYATLSDYQDRHTVATEHQTFVSTLLEDACALLDKRVPTLAQRVTTNTRLGTIAKVVVTQAVARVMSNPFNIVTETIGPFSYRHGQASVTLFYRDDEIELLTYRAVTASDYARTISTDGRDRHRYWTCTPPTST